MSKSTCPEPFPTGCTGDGSTRREDRLPTSHLAFDVSLRGGHPMLDTPRRLHKVKRNEEHMNVLKMRSKP